MNAPRPSAGARAAEARSVAAVTIGAIIGTVAWLVTFASAPRTSLGGEQQTGNGLYFLVLLAGALVGGWLIRHRARLVGLAMGVPGFVLSPWTAPRGDEDGLWILIVPMLAFFTAFLAGTAHLGAALRHRTSPHRPRSDRP